MMPPLFVITMHLEPDSVILRDLAGKQPIPSAGAKLSLRGLLAPVATTSSNGSTLRYRVRVLSGLCYLE